MNRYRSYIVKCIKSGAVFIRNRIHLRPRSMEYNDSEMFMKLSVRNINPLPNHDKCSTQQDPSKELLSDCDNQLTPDSHTLESSKPDEDSHSKNTIPRQSNRKKTATKRLLQEI